MRGHTARVSHIQKDNSLMFSGINDLVALQTLIEITFGIIIKMCLKK